MALATLMSFMQCMSVQARSSGNGVPEYSVKDRSVLEDRSLLVDDAPEFSFDDDGMCFLNLLQHSAAVHSRAAQNTKSAAPPQMHKSGCPHELGCAHEAKVAKISMQDSAPGDFVQRPSVVSTSSNSEDVHLNTAREYLVNTWNSIHQRAALTDTKATPARGNQLGEACLLGCVFGVLHVVCPDHLVTVLALSIGQPSKEAFLAGFIYGGGHSVGILVCAFAIEVFRQALGSRVQGPFEYWANYAVGLSIVACGLYLSYKQSSVLKEDAAGRIEVQGCCGGACADSGGAPCGDGGFKRAVRNVSKPARKRVGERGLKLVVQNANLSECPPPPPQFAGLPKDVEECPPPPPPPFPNAFRLNKGGVHQRSDNSLPGNEEDAFENPSPRPSPGQDYRECPPPPPPFADAEESRGHSMLVSLSIGLGQGFFCPIFWILSTMIIQLGFEGVLCFLPIFFAVSCVGMGLMSMLGGYCSGTEGIGACVPLKTLYQAGVVLTVSIGIAWMVLTYCLGRE